MRGIYSCALCESLLDHIIKLRTNFNRANLIKIALHDVAHMSFVGFSSPIKRNCGKPFTIDHAMVCHMGGFPTIRHNEIRDLTASLLTEVCPNVAIEPQLQPLSGETLRLASANTDDGARLDVRARGFWNTCQDAYFDVRVFHPNVPSNHSRSLPRTRSMKMKRNECRASVYLKSNMASSPHLYFQPQVVWEEKLRPSTNAWPTCCL